MTYLLPALALLATTTTPADTLSDDALVTYASKPFDKQKFHQHEVLGVHHGTQVVVEFPCSDVCPDYTVRLIHYDAAPGPDCDKIGGVTRMMMVPFSIAVVRRPFCVPKVLVDRNLS